MNDIKQVFDEIINNFSLKLQDYNWEDQIFYGEWLFQTYKFVSHSTRLLALGAGYAPLQNNQLHNRFISHLSEEKGHEVIALQCLKRLGYTENKFEESSATKLFYRHQYWSVQNNGPYALLGWILFLEGIAFYCGPKILEKVKKFDAKANIFLKLHTDEDKDHLESAFKIIVNTSEVEKKLLIENMKFSYDSYVAILDSISLNSKLKVKSA